MNPQKRKKAERKIGWTLAFGLALISYGIGLWSIPAALTFVGVVFLICGICGLVILKDMKDDEHKEKSDA